MYDKYYKRSIKFQNISKEPVKKQMQDKATKKYMIIYVKDLAFSLLLI